MPLSVGELGPYPYNVAWAEAYLHAKFHLDPSNRLATMHQRHIQYRHTGQRSDDRANGFTNGCPKTAVATCRFPDTQFQSLQVGKSYANLSL